jgi:guanosine-3',5'-bis(diphosphate) 3'-pyrophosphohydrolase
MIDKALEFATRKHAKQFRKGTNIPYVVHCIEVMLILLRENYEREIIVAGILHDTLEDTDTTYQELADEFGTMVAELVLYCSEDKSQSWKERKTKTIQNMFDQLDRKGNLIVLADKNANLRDTYREYRRYCYNKWDKFNEGYDAQKWYHESILEAAIFYSGTKVYNEYEDLVDIIFHKNYQYKEPYII